MTDADRWRRLERVLDVVLGRDPVEWPALLDAACADDADLRREADDLLSRRNSVEGFLETPPAALAAAIVAEGRASAQGIVGRRIGAHRVLREIGAGGMSRVYLAERADGQFELRVAIKVMRPGFDAELDRERFRTERQILASLNHPNIARLYDGGVMDDGSPYLVLELVEGQPLDRYCDEHRLTIRQRLELFLQVIDATQYAHRNLVVHRDLKPGNILVAADGTVKLLDFGIAKLLGRQPAADSMPTTGTRGHWMTPEYAAPEQIVGGPVTTLTDVYQLGAVLYELLTGRPPFGPRGAAVHALEEAVLHDEPSLPSSRFVTTRTVDGGAEAVLAAAACRRADPGAARAALRGDIDAIVLTAMRKEPERRYATVESFGGDVRHHLAGAPVLARKQTTLYRAGRFARRHRWPIAGVAAFLLSAVAYAISLTVQRAHIERALADATLSAHKAEQVTDLMLGLFGSSEGGRAFSDTSAARELLDVASARARDMVSPEVRAQLLDVVGSIHEQLGNYVDAQSAFEEALVARKSNLPEDHPDVARSYVNIADVLSSRRLYDEALRHQRAALDIHRRQLGPDHPRTLQTTFWLANILHESGDAAAAAPLFDNWARMVLSSPRQVTAAQAVQLVNLGGMRQVQGDLESAETLFREALAIYHELYGERHPSALNALRRIGTTLVLAGRFDEAERVLAGAVAHLRAAYPNGHGDLAAAIRSHAHTLKRLARWDEAELLFEEALEMRVQLHEPDHVFIGNGFEDLGVLLAQRGEHARAEPFLRNATRIYTARFGDSSVLTLRAGAGLGEALRGQGLLADAEPLLVRGYAALASPRGASMGDDPRRFVLESLIRLYDAQGRADLAAKYRGLLDN